MSRSLLSLLWIFVCCSAWSQSTDLFRAEYTILPKDDSDIRVARYRFLVNVPFKVTEDQYLVTGAEYNQVVVGSDRELPFDEEQIEKLHVIDLNLGYIFKWNEDWRFVAILSPRLASNLVGGIQGRDLKMNATATFWKEKKDAEKPYRLVLGLSYNATTGLPFPLPLVSYYRRFHPDWSFALGVPKSQLKYHLDKRHTLETALFLDGYFVNIQDDLIFDDNSRAASISLSALVAALGYQYNIDKHISLFAMAGYTVTQDGVLRDDRRKNVYVLNDQGNIYFRTGFKVSLF
ncbi:DUF6268 family outer membrane beta-barrel protein [Zeaxanthinibacter enoshimensis]|uniref:DUF6268 family outer membrane beta-barrel protein n=1 Tax=Zeaxanthinibacter enoshimensis TaxID=392009 RepID=UPI0035696A52